MKRPRSPERQALMERFFAVGREQSAATIMFHSALAARQGLSPTEEKALDLLDRHGPVTARRLTELSGLAPASVTGLVDRLEAKGFARRLANPADGRSVLIEPVPDRLGSLASLFDDWTAELERLCDGYTEEQLKVIVDFLAQATIRQARATERLIEEAQESMGAPIPAPAA